MSRPACTSGQESDLNVSFEYFPPATPVGNERLAECADMLSVFAPTFSSVTYGAGGADQEKTLATIDQLGRSSEDPVAGHLTCVRRSAAEVNDVIDEYRSRGVRHIVALRGDAPADCADGGVHPEGLASAAELVSAIRSRPDGADFEISVAAYPEVHPKADSASADMDNLKRKIDAGADRAITQFAFDTEAIIRFIDEADRAGISVPIVPGIMPVTNFANICRFSARCGTAIPSWMPELFDGLDDTPEVRDMVAATVAAEQCKQLAEHGVRDFHFYTMNKPHLTAATCRTLGLGVQAQREPVLAGASPS